MTEALHPRPSEQPAAPPFLDAQKQALEMIVKGEPLQRVLDHLTRVVESQSNNTVAAAILLLDDENRLRNGAAPSVPHVYSAAIDGLRIDPDLGTCAAAAATGRVVITTDFDTDPGWATLKHLPLQHGLVAAWSQPIVNRNGRVLGTFGTYFRERRAPTASERRIVEILSHTAALAIERARADEERAAEAQAKDEFIATLSHELRNPLASLRTAGQLLATAAENPDAVRRLQTRMSRQVEHLVRLVDDLLDVSRVTRGDLRLQLQPVDMNMIVDAAIESCSEAVTAAALELRVVKSPGALVTGDPFRLQQIVANLVNNATKYTHPGGRVAIELQRNDGTVALAVSDNGIGIDEADLERIFDAFVRVHDESVNSQWGLGLGLALSRRLAMMHGGSLHAASKGRGHGSEFVLRLPSVDAPSASRND